MNLTCNCPRCQQTSRIEFDSSTPELACAKCEHHWSVPAGTVNEDQVSRCLVCGGNELFARKDFSQRLGVTIVVVGLAASCIPWYFHEWYASFAILFGTALIDVVLYVIMGNVLECYRCHAQYRGVAGLDEHGAFKLEVYERYRQQAARLAQNQAEAATKS
jgi:hypothetical protein